MKPSTPVLLLAAMLPLASCTVTRLQRLERHGEAVASSLKAEQRAAVALPASPARDARLAQLTSLRHQLSGVNLGLSAARFLEPDYRESAYDVVEQAYDTIDWNIAMPPGGTPRAMPGAWDGTTLRFGAPDPGSAPGLPIQPIR